MNSAEAKIEQAIDMLVEQDQNYIYYQVVCSSNPYWPSGGVVYTGTKSEIFAQLSEFDLEKRIKDFWNREASGLAPGEIKVFADGDWEHFALGKLPGVTKEDLIYEIAKYWIEGQGGVVSREKFDEWLRLGSRDTDLISFLEQPLPEEL